MLLYVGPGIGLASFVIVAIVMSIVLFSVIVVSIRPIKRGFAYIKSLFYGK
jgi:hypothetical protein